jgi:TRAP-type C4-dicarboxylate transport system permease small subunit
MRRKKVTRLLDSVCSFLALLGSIVLVFTTCSIGYSILTRMTGLANPIWTVQFNEYALLWMTFLGTAWLLAEDKHIALAVVTDRLVPGANRLLNVFHNLVGTILCGVFCWYGFSTTRDHLARHVLDTMAVDVPKGYVLAIIPLGFSLLTLQFLFKLIRTLRGQDIDAGQQERSVDVL